jgi:SH3-like domain-containing protein
LFTVEKGVPFTVLGKKEAWLNVQHGDGDKGWIHQSLIW